MSGLISNRIPASHSHDNKGSRKSTPAVLRKGDIAVNKAYQIGRLTADPEVRYTQGQNSTAIAKFSIAVDRRFKREGEPEADFFKWTAFGKQAEFIEKYFSKGMKVVLIGREQNDNFVGKDGQKVYSTNHIVEEVEFAESKSAQSGGTNFAAASATTPGDGFMNIPTGFDDELPFS